MAIPVYTSIVKILLFGSRGYLGEQFQKLYPHALCPKMDIADAKGVAEILECEKPDVVINAAGKTGRPNIDWCETHKEETVHSNVLGPLVLLEECMKRKTYLVHLSSGCIYEGDNHGKGFSENDPPNFAGSFYSRTKAWIDMLLSEFPVLILRLRMPFDGSRNERNLIMKLAKYPKVLDVKNSLTYLPDLLVTAKNLIKKKKTGVYHVVNPGNISPYEVMLRYKEMVDPSHTVERLTLQDLGTVVQAGRSNCILSTAKLESEGIRLQPLDKALNEAFRMLKM